MGKDMIKSKLKTFEAGKVLGAIVIDYRSNREGKYNVRYRLTYKRKRKYISAGYSFTLDEWCKLNSNKLKDGELKKRKGALINEFNAIENEIIEIGTGDIAFNFELLIKRLASSNQNCLLTAFDDKFNDFEVNGQVGTASLYRSAKNFIKAYSGNITFGQVNKKWLSECEKHAIESQELSYSTLSMYLRCLRSVFNTAIANGIIKATDYPFARKEAEINKYRIKQGIGTKNALTTQQIAAISSFQTDSTVTARGRDIFMLSFYLAGINMKDLLLAKWTDIKQGELCFYRQKTIRTNSKVKSIKTPISEAALNIINRLNPGKKGEYILPFMVSNPTPYDIRRITQKIIKSTNKALKQIRDSLGIYELSTYTARHTAATLLKNAGVPISFIGEMLGHSDIKTTMNYLKSFESEQRKKNIEILSNLPFNNG